MPALALKRLAAASPAGGAVTGLDWQSIMTQSGGFTVALEAIENYGYRTVMEELASCHFDFKVSNSVGKRGAVFCEFPPDNAVWLNFWQIARKRVSPFMTLNDPTIIEDPAAALAVGMLNPHTGKSEIAGISMASQDTYISNHTLSAHKPQLYAYLVEIMAHEMGHHLWTPKHSQRAVIINSFANKVLEDPQKSAMAANLYEDMIINTRLLKEHDLRMVALYQAMNHGKTRHDSKLWQLYMRAYEILWELKPGTLTDPVAKSIETDARRLAGIIHTYGLDQGPKAGVSELVGMRKFAKVIQPYLDPPGMQEASEKSPDQHSAQSARQQSQKQKTEKSKKTAQAGAAAEGEAGSGDAGEAQTSETDDTKSKAGKTKGNKGKKSEAEKMAEKASQKAAQGEFEDGEPESDLAEETQAAAEQATSDAGDDLSTKDADEMEAESFDDDYVEGEQNQVSKADSGAAGGQVKEYDVPESGPADEPTDTEGDRRKITGDFQNTIRDMAQFKAMVQASGRQVSELALVIMYYRDLARRFLNLIRIPRVPQPVVPGKVDAGVTGWKMGHPVDEIDWVNTVAYGGIPIFGANILKRKHVPRAEPSTENSPLPMWLDIYVDASGSMGNAMQQLSYQALAGVVLAMAAIQQGAKVRVTVYGSNQPGHSISTNKFCNTVEEVVAHIVQPMHVASSTTFPHWRVVDAYQQALPEGAKAHIAVISDNEAVYMVGDRDWKTKQPGKDVMRWALQQAGAGGSLLIRDYYGGTEDSRIKKELEPLIQAGYNYYPLINWEQLLAFCRAFSLANYLTGR